VEEFTSSISFDQRMYRQDILGSMAHARMLDRCGILTGDETELIINGLTSILADIEAGNFTFEIALEDIHMNVEKRLTERIGPVGGKLHTARSRNDQVALDTHMYMKAAIQSIAALVHRLEQSLLEVAEANIDVILPGYTHLQRAQPVLFSHHLLAYFHMLARDFDRLRGVWDRTDIMPLGAGALAGTTFPIDRRMVAEELKFSRIYANSMDAVSDRDYILEFLSFASILMVHLSRLSEEMILWSSTEFAFIELDDAHCTGSSIMPQKKNPDVCELVRGKTGRVVGHLMAMLTILKGLPMTYNKDLQEDKEGAFDTIDTLKFSLSVYADMLKGMKINSQRMRQMLDDDFSNATDMADYLVRKGLPFREAHAVVGRAVRLAIETQRSLTELPLSELLALCPLFEEDILPALQIETCIEARNSEGGTASTQVRQALTNCRSIMQLQQTTIDMYTKSNI
jgi:argininosuccinate lyase